MQQRALLAVLALALALTAAQASRVLEDGSSASRQLQQTINTANARCPDGCQRPGFARNGFDEQDRTLYPNDYCQEDSTSGGLFCTQCYGSLMVKLSNGRCSCPRGKYSVGNATDPVDNYVCKDCPKNSYCAGGDFVADVFESGKQSCPNDMWTIGARTETVRGCVNRPGYSYSIDASGTPSQTICPENTYGPGYKKQRSCVPCPTGFTTRGTIGNVRPTACIVPAGYYLKAPGQAAPCPMGEWKSGEGPSGNCTKCAFGVTTDSEGSIAEANCTRLLPGRYATAMDGNTITATQICPQKYYCPGGYPSTILFNTSNPGALNATEEQTIIVCPEGTWTQELGSTDVQQCLTPPGYRTFNQNTTKCEAGYYRADWKPQNQATNCLWCGNGVGAELTDRLKVYDLTDPTVVTYEPITSSSDDCFIEPGQGLYYSTITGQWRARNCDDDNYGVTNRTFGLTPSPCRDCPAGMITNVNSSAYYYNDTANFASAYGYIDPLACVTQAGYGYNGRIAQPCDKGSYNPQGTRSTCTTCGYGYTTDAVGGTVDLTDPSEIVGDSASDCGVAAGFGFYNMSGTFTLVPCPRGTFNNDTWDSNTTAICTACSDIGGAGLFTLTEGSDSSADCSVCAGGYGGADCATQCGGGTGDLATFGLPDQPEGTPCTNCSYSGTGYSFEVNATNIVYAPPAVARAGANSTKDCVAAWLQVVDKAWYMPFTIVATNTTTTTKSSFEDCLEECSSDACAFVTYDYDNGECTTVTPDAALVWDGYVAWKVGPAGDIARSGSLSDDKVSTNAQVNEQGEVIKPKAVPSGFYSWYKDASYDQYGMLPQPYAANYTSTPPTTIQDCLNICDEQAECAGVTFKVATIPGQTAAECKLVFGNKDLGDFRRTFLRTAVGKFTKPVEVAD